MFSDLPEESETGEARRQGRSSGVQPEATCPPDHEGFCEVEPRDRPQRLWEDSTPAHVPLRATVSSLCSCFPPGQCPCRPGRRAGARLIHPRRKPPSGPRTPFPAPATQAGATGTPRVLGPDGLVPRLPDEGRVAMETPGSSDNSSCAFKPESPVNTQVK